MQNNKLIPIILMIILCMPLAFAQIEYNQIQGDSIFVVGVDWQKQSENGSYIAYLTVDLNYVQYSNPLDRYEIVERYNYNNWWADWFRFDESDIGIVGNQVENTDGDFFNLIQLYYYWEIPSADYDPSNQIGYYGLPFYIQSVDFTCDSTLTQKGSIHLEPGNDEVDNFALTRPSYDGINDPILQVDTSVVPLGWITNPGQIVRYNGIPVFCKNMQTTTNSVLSFTLKPNPIYRHINPNNESSEIWEYDDIISTLPSVANNQELPFNLNIDFNFTGNYWNYSVSNEDLNNTINVLFGDVNDNDLDCYIDSTQEFIKFRELTTAQQQIINTGDGISCSFPTTPGIETINNKQSNNIIDAISIQNQREILLQLDQLESKLKLKKFVVNQVIPFFGIMIILIFYIFQLIMFGVIIFGMIPLMFIEFINGLKSAFDIDELIKDLKVKRKK